MDINDIETAEHAFQASNRTNFWTDTSNQALFFVVDANFFVLLPLLCFNVNKTSLSIFGLMFLFFCFLKRKDITFFELIDIVKLIVTGCKYRRFN